MVALACAVVAVVVGSGILASWSASEGRDQERQRDQSLLVETVAALEAVDDVLSSAVTAQVMAIDGVVTAEEFDVYAARMLDLPAVSSIGYEPRVIGADRAAFEASTGVIIQDRDTSGALVPAAERDEYFPVLFVAPPSLAIAIGFDVAGEPIRAAAIETARRTGRPAGTPPVSLAPTGDTGVLVLTPLRDPAEGGADPADLVGLVSVGYFADDLASRLSSLLTPGSRVTIADEGAVLVRLGAIEGSAPSTEVEVVGRTWTIEVQHPDRASLVGSGLIGASGLALAVALSAIGGSFIRQRRRLELATAQVTRLQAATWELARCETPDEVRGTARRHVAAAMAAPAARWVDDAATRTPSATVIDVPVTGSDGSSIVVSDPSHATPTDVELAISIATVAGFALRRATTREFEHLMAETLQHQLAATSIPSLADAEVAARYVSAIGEAGIGGDWFDVIDLGPGRFAVTVGDVVGSGVTAAGAMGQLRIAMRSLAGTVPAAEVLGHLDRLAADIPHGEVSTALHAHVDVRLGRLTYAAAGHPPPVLATTRSTELLWGGRSQPLGVGCDGRRPSGTVDVAPGARLVVYTDGLVERRGEPLDVGLERLRAAVEATAHRSTEDALDELIERLAAGAHDDIVVVVATLT